MASIINSAAFLAGTPNGPAADPERNITNPIFTVSAAQEDATGLINNVAPIAAIPRQRIARLLYFINYSKRNELAEHQAIKDAAINRKTEEAIKHLYDHYNKTGKIILEAGIITI